MLTTALLTREEQTNNTFINTLAAFEKRVFHRDLAWDKSDFKWTLASARIKIIVLKDLEKSSEIIHGYCLYKQHEDYLSIQSLAVSASMRGQNFGRSMLKHALDSASNKNDFFMVLECMPSLEGYYAKMGFTEYKGRTPEYYEVSDDEFDALNMKVTKEKFDEIISNCAVEELFRQSV